MIPVLAMQSMAVQKMTMIVAFTGREAMCPPVRMV
jgi:hypothetical protein